MLTILGDKNSIFNQFLAELRDKQAQKDSMRFRKNLERIGEIFAYEISKELNYTFKEIETPLGISKVAILKEIPLIASIMRAGLPMHQGFLNYFDKADNAFISGYRKYSKDGSFTIKFEYLSSPSVEKRILIISDPMLASGSSMEMAYNAILTKGKPLHTHIVSVIASKDGLNYLQKHLPMNQISLWVGAVDDELTKHAYIVPGLGDAGDLAYGSKV